MYHSVVGDDMRESSIQPSTARLPRTTFPVHTLILSIRVIIIVLVTQAYDSESSIDSFKYLPSTYFGPSFVLSLDPAL